MLTPHAARIKTFMNGIDHLVPAQPTMPSSDVRVFRARLILEEAIETCHALGMQLSVNGIVLANELAIKVSPTATPNMAKIADGCADISVVTIGTMLACGLEDEPILQEVDAANLRKIGPGATKRSDGKWLKPPNWVGPDIVGQLAAQGWVER